MMSRRLPVYLLLDCSESMAGTAIEEVSRGVNALVDELRKNPMALETAHLSVITFSRYARQVCQLTDIMAFRPPPLSVRPGTAMGAAIHLLLQCLKKEVVKTTPTTKGDYKPLVFLFTDGQPTDDWSSAVATLRAANNPKIANIYAIGCGADVDTESLRGITDIVLRMQDLSPDAWRKVFVWLSASVSSASIKLNTGDGQTPFGMADLPSELTYVPAGSTNYRDSEPRQVFLTALCQKMRRPYLMRFARQGSYQHYTAICAHKLDTIEEGDGDLLPQINSSQLDGCPDCPYCGNEIAGQCPCGAIFCESPHNRGPATCPKCHSTLGYGGSGNFEIQRSQG